MSLLEIKVDFEEIENGKCSLAKLLIKQDKKKPVGGLGLGNSDIQAGTKSPPFLFPSFFPLFRPAGSCAFGFYPPNPPSVFSLPLVIVVAPVLESPVPPSAVAGYYCWLASKIARETRSDEYLILHVARPASSSGSFDFPRRWTMSKPG